MRRIQLSDLPIRGLEYVFSPPGLPLVEKPPSAKPTTSALVRGPAGAGKTTLALALARAIAAYNQGVILYLSSEITPMELLYKAELLGLPEGLVVGWEDRGVAQAGGVVAQHVALVGAGEEAVSVAEQQRSAIGIIREMVETYSREGHPAPVSAVVVDAFALPELGGEEPGLRSHVLAMVQALEGQGISVILVDELGAEASDALSFVVDLMFEVAFDHDPDTRELIRKLICRKSRYVVSLAGPHDYGLENGRPAVWPDVLGIMSGQAAGRFAVKPAQQAKLFLLHENAVHSYSELMGERLIISNSMLWTLAHTPGVRLAHVRCGPLSVIGGLNRKTVSQVSEGPFALAWLLLDALKEGQINAVVFHSLDQLLGRKRFSFTMHHVLDTLRKLGVLVLIHGVSANLQREYSLVDWLDGGTNQFGVLHHHPSESIRRMPERWHRSALLWIINFAGLEPEVYATGSELGVMQDLQSKLATAQSLYEEGRLAEAAEALRLNIDSLPAGAASLMLRAARLLARCGALGQAGLYANRVRSMVSDPTGLAAVACTYYLLDNDWEAARLAQQALQGQPHPTIRLLWNGLCSFYVGAPFDASVEQRPDLAAALLLRGAYQRLSPEELQVVDDGLEKIAETAAQPPWFARRLRADVGLESDDLKLIERSRDLLRELSADESLPRAHRAEVLHNLGIAEERLGNREAAIAALRQALEVNPVHERSTAKLLNLGA